MKWYSHKIYLYIDIYLYYRLYIYTHWDLFSPSVQSMWTVCSICGISDRSSFFWCVWWAIAAAEKDWQLGQWLWARCFLVLVGFACTCRIYVCVYIYIYDLPDTPSLKRYMCEHTDYEHVYHRIRAFVELQLQSPATNHNGRLYPLHNTLKPHSFCTPILCVKGFLGVARIAGMKQHFRFISQKSIGVSLREWSARCKGHLLHDGCVHSI